MKRKLSKKKISDFVTQKILNNIFSEKFIKKNLFPIKKENPLALKLLINLQ